MPQRKYPRIEIDQRAYDALQAEGIRRHRTSREIATEAILGYVSKESIAFIDQSTIGPQNHKTIVTDAPETFVCTPTQPEDQKTIIKKKRLVTDSSAIATIKEMWKQTHNTSEIGQKIGYSRNTVYDYIQREKKKGESWVI
jgi:hypothetical protein